MIFGPTGVCRDDPGAEIWLKMLQISLFRSSMSMNFQVQAEASACLEPRLAVRLGGVGGIVNLLLAFYGLRGLYVLLYALLKLLAQKCYYYK